MGKKYKDMRSKIDRQRRYSLTEACALIKEVSFAKFDETVDAAVRLGVNPRHADQMIRSSVSLPHGTGKSVRVLVFAKGDKAERAKQAGADFVGSDDLVQKIQGDGWLDFDVAIATPDMMGLVGRLGRILGPRNLMPNPKVGTVTMDVETAVRERKAGRIEFRTERTGIIHAPIGKVSFEATSLEENLQTLLKTLQRLKPATAKGKYFKSVSISSTMGPGIPLDTNEVQAFVTE